MAHEEASSPPNSPTLSLFPLSSEKLISSELRPRRNPPISEAPPSTTLCLSSQHLIDLTEDEEEAVVILSQESVSRKRKSPANYVSNKLSVKAGKEKKKEPDVVTRNLISNIERSRFCEEKEWADIQEWVFAASSSSPPSTALSLSLPEYSQVKNQEEAGVSDRISYATKKSLDKYPKDWLSLTSQRIKKQRGMNG